MRSRGGDRGESGKFSLERIASTAMDGSSWPARVGCCPSPWASSSSQVDYSSYLSKSSVSGVQYQGGVRHRFEMDHGNETTLVVSIDAESFLIV